MELFRGSARMQCMAKKRNPTAAATKADLEAFQAALTGDMVGLRAELKGDIEGLRQEFSAALKSETGGLRAELKGDIDGLRAEMQEGFRRAALADDRLGVRISRLEETLITGLAENRNEVARVLDAATSRMETLWRETLSFPAILDEHGRRLAALEARRAP